MIQAIKEHALLEIAHSHANTSIAATIIIIIILSLFQDAPSSEKRRNEAVLAGSASARVTHEMRLRVDDAILPLLVLEPAL
jgi:hypothetical protein